MNQPTIVLFPKLAKKTGGIKRKAIGSAQRVTERTGFVGANDGAEKPQHLVGGGWRAARPGWNDLYFVPLLLRSVCEPHPRDCSLLLRGVRTFYCSCEFRSE